MLGPELIPTESVLLEVPETVTVFLTGTRGPTRIEEGAELDAEGLKGIVVVVNKVLEVNQEEFESG
jgi:hypothetical protein